MKRIEICPYPILIREVRTMQWIERLNEALYYIEEHLEGEISYEKAARLANCSTYHFQRMFTYIAGVPLGEYIRRRRLTKAALALQQGQKVLDVSLRYGYDSPTSFTRAFQTLHGVNPSEAKKEGAALKAFPKISFSLTIKGDQEMEYRIERKETFQVTGVSLKLEKDMEENMKTIPQFWNKKTMDGTIPKLCALLKPGQGLFGLCTNTDDKDYWLYTIGIETKEEPPIEGMEIQEVEASLWAIFPGRGAMPKVIQEVEKRIMTDWLPTSGYELSKGVDVEVYLSEDPSDQAFEVWMPIRKQR
ncbi:MAG: AraC family transcriptional regulator [Sphaerochaetaceae bacterium]